MSTAKYDFYLVKTRFHGGGIISQHRTMEAAEAAATRWTVKSCTCGCCGVVAICDYNNLPDYDDCRSPYDLCK
jgi:hypothetical protein